MEHIISFFHYLMNSEEIIQTGGLIAIVLIVYIENGLFFGFFLPGDYLLFLSGVFAGLGLLKVTLFMLLLGVISAAILGAFTGYFSGRFFGERIALKKDNLFFKQEYLTKTQKYFEKFGPRTLVIARFLPIIRTFAPILAGLVKMNIFQFSIYNIVGAVVWVVILVGGGFYLGVQFPGIIDYVYLVVIFFLVVTTFTVIKGYFSARKEID